MTQRPPTPAGSMRESQIMDITEQIMRLRSENLALNSQNQALAAKFEKLTAYNQSLGDDVANSDRQIYLLEHQIDERQEMMQVVVAEINHVQREIKKLRRILLKDKKFRKGVVEIVKIEESTAEIGAKIKDATELIGSPDVDNLALLREKLREIELSNEELDRQVELLKLLLNQEASNEDKMQKLEEMMRRQDEETEKLLDEVQEQQDKNAAEALKRKRAASSLRQTREETLKAKEIFGEMSEWPEVSSDSPTPSEVERREREERERLEREERERKEQEERERLEQERLEKERLEREEQERLERERLEREEQERLERERLEREEQERLERERLEREEQERLEKERLEREEQERLERERLEKEEQERLAREAEERRRKRRKRRKKEIKPKEPEQPFSDDEIEKDRMNQQMLKDRQRESEDLLKSLKDALENQEKERDALMEEIAKASEKRLIMKTLPDMTVVIKDAETDEDILERLRTHRKEFTSVDANQPNSESQETDRDKLSHQNGLNSESRNSRDKDGDALAHQKGPNSESHEKDGDKLSRQNGPNSESRSKDGDALAHQNGFDSHKDTKRRVAAEVQTNVTSRDIQRRENLIEERKKQAEELERLTQKLGNTKEEIEEVEDTMERVKLDTAKREEEIKRVKEEIELAKLKQELLKGLAKIKKEGMSKEEIKVALKEAMRKKREEVSRILLRSKTAEQKLAELIRYREVLDQDLYDMDHREKPEVKRLQSEVKVFNSRVSESRKSLEESIALRDAKRQEYAEVKSAENLNEVLDLMVQRNKLERREAKWRAFSKESWDSLHALEDFSEANQARRVQISEQLQKYERDLLMATHGLHELNEYSDLLGALISEHTSHWTSK